MMIKKSSLISGSAALAVSLWSFVILPIAPTYAAFQASSPASQVQNSQQDTVPSHSSNGTDDDAIARTLAGYTQSTGNMLASGNTDMATAAGDQVRSAVSGAATAEVQRWFSGFGTARVRLDVDRNFTLKNSEFEMLLPWYDRGDTLFFSQHSIHRTDGRLQTNHGVGMRHFGETWMKGVNTFLDHDLTRYHTRAGLGTELWRDYLNLGANGYFRLSGWRDAPEMNNDYEARPANGWDVRAEGWIPAYPQVGGKLTVKQYYGNEVVLFGTGNRQKNPQAVTAGLNWTPVPLVTLSAEHSMGNGGINDDRFGLQLTWTPGMSLSQQLDPDAVRERRTLAGSRLDLVERNNNIVLEYRKKELIKLSLLPRAEGMQGQVFTLVTGLQTKYPLQAIDWSAGDFLAAGGQISGNGTTTQFIFPAYRPGATTAQAQQLNTYTVTALASDSHGNVSSRAQSVLVVESPGGVQIQPGDLTASSGARANGTDVNTATAIVTNSAGQPVAGETVIFTLQSGINPAGIARSSTIRVTTSGSGVASLDMVSLMSGTYSVQVQAGTAPAASTTTTFFQNTDAGNPNILNLEITAPENNAVADGVAANKVSVVVKDQADVIQANESVRFSVTPGATVSTSDVNTNDSGVADVMLVSTTPGMYTVTASAGGGTRTMPVTFTAVQLQGTLTASPDAYMVGDRINSSLTLVITDQNGTPKPGKTVTFRGNSIILDFSSVTDHGNGTYTAQVTTVPATASPMNLVIDAIVGGQTLPGAKATLTVTAPQPVFTMMADTQMNPFTFVANSGFPTTGFAGATFTVLAPSGTAGDYTWTAQTPSGGTVNWLSVDQGGVVTFNSKPGSADKAVEIIATPKAGGQPLGYRFALDEWFINNGSNFMNWSAATAFCRSQSGYSLPLLQQLNGSATHGPGVRGILGGLWSEWGSVSKYVGSGLYNTEYWSSSVTVDLTHDGAQMNSGVSAPYWNTAMLYVMCRQGL